MDLRVTLFWLVTCLSAEISTLSIHSDIRNWTVSRIAKDSIRDLIFYQGINKASCTSLNSMQYGNNGCECSFPTGIFYIDKRGRTGCFLADNICKDIGKDCERLVVTVQENNSQMIQMSLRATTINPDGCDRLLENGTKLWTDGRWKEEVISVKISTKQNQKSNLTSHEIQLTGTERFSGKLIGLKLTCNGTEEDVQKLLLLKVTGTALISLFSGSSFSPTNNSVNTTNVNIDSNMLTLSSTVVVTPSSTATTLFTTSSVIKNTAIPTRRTTRTIITTPSISTTYANLTASPSQLHTTQTKTILPLTSATITDKNGFTKTENSDISTKTNANSISESRFVSAVTGAFIPNVPIVSTVSKVLSQLPDVNEPAKERPPALDRNLMIIIIALVFVVVVLVGVVALLIRTRKKSKLNVSLQQNVCNPTYAQAGHLNQHKDKNHNNKNNKKELEKTESQQPLKEYTSLDEEENPANLYHTLESEKRNNSQIPPRPIEHLYSYTNPALIMPGHSMSVSGQIARPHPLCLSTFQSVRRTHAESLPGKMRRKPVYVETEPVKQENGKQFTGTSTNEPVYLEPDLKETLTKDLREFQQSLAKDPESGICTYPIPQNTSTNETVLTSNEPFYFETEKEFDVNDHADAEAGNSREPLYFETEPDPICYETIPDTYDNVGNKQLELRMYDTEYEQINNQQHVNSNEPVYSDIPMILDEVSRVKLSEPK